MIHPCILVDDYIYSKVLALLNIGGLRVPRTDPDAECRKDSIDGFELEGERYQNYFAPVGSFTSVCSPEG